MRLFCLEIGCGSKKKKDKTKQTQDETKQEDIFESNKAGKPAPVGMILTRATQVDDKSGSKKNKIKILQQTSVLEYDEDITPNTSKWNSKVLPRLSNISNKSFGKSSTTNFGS